MTWMMGWLGSVSHHAVSKSVVFVYMVKLELLLLDGTKWFGLIRGHRFDGMYYTRSMNDLKLHTFHLCLILMAKHEDSAFQT